jgi:hypothetical protein
VFGSREDAEIALARLKVADHEKRLPTGGSRARSVTAAFQLYLQAVDAGLVELAPRTRVTVRSATNTMSASFWPMVGSSEISASPGLRGKTLKRFMRR